MGEEFSYGDWVKILPLTREDIENGAILAPSRTSRLLKEDVAELISNKVVKITESTYLDGKKYFYVSRSMDIKISSDVIEKIDTILARKSVETQDIKIGDIIEGNALSDVFYNMTNTEMKKGIVWDMSEGSMSVIILENENFNDAYGTVSCMGNYYGDLAAAYNSFNVVGHTDLIKLKVHCDYLPPRYSGKKYACYGSLGAFLDNFTITVGNVRETLGYCPVTRLFETGNITEFEDAINANTSLRIEIVR